MWAADNSSCDCDFSGGCCSTVEEKASQEEYENEDNYVL